MADIRGLTLGNSGFGSIAELATSNLDGLFTGAMMEKTLFEERSLVLSFQAGELIAKRAVEIEAMLIRVRRVEQRVKTGLPFKSEVTNGSQDGPVWW